MIKKQLTRETKTKVLYGLMSSHRSSLRLLCGSEGTLPKF